MRLRYLQAAADDLERLQLFLAQKDPNAAAAAAQTIRSAVRDLVEFSPERGTPMGRMGLRQLFVQFGRSAYVVRYRIDVKRDELLVVRVWHGRERRN